MSKVNAVVAGAVLIAAAPALAAQCNHKGGIKSFIADFKREAASKGISSKGLAALDGLALDDKVLAADKRQGVFKQSFEDFSGRMISRDRLVKGAKLIQQHAETIKRIEKQYACRARSWSRSGDWRPTTASTRAKCWWCARWRRSPMITAAPTSSRPNSSTRCASSIAATWPRPI